MPRSRVETCSWAFVLGARTLLGAPGRTSRSKDATRNKGGEAAPDLPAIKGTPLVWQDNREPEQGPTLTMMFSLITTERGLGSI